MANSFTQYLKDTRTELRHVAWPTRTQTIVYAVLVAGISVGIAVYLGFFDFLFTTGLAHFIDTLPQASQSAPLEAASSSTSNNGVSVTKIPLPATGTTPTFPVNLK